jgi:CheY-like chemotaxis protein
MARDTSREGMLTRAPPPILFVDDDRCVRESVRLVLERAGYQVLTACNGSAALALLDNIEIQPLVVLTDLMMPVMGGLEFLSRLRARERFAVTPVLLIAASPSRLPERLLARFDRYLRKPVPAAMLINAVSALAAATATCGTATK